jgi:UDP-N-acetylmuramyl pentapeptide phosphotransferase/UDP-N-acetylglucosamine-1-phosphate transferase
MSWYASWAALAALTAVLSFAAVGLVLVFARRRALFAIPEARSSHTVPTPSGGGLGIVAAIFLSWTASFAYRSGSSALAAPTLAVPLLALAVLVATATGLADDRHALRAKPKMLLIVGAAALALPAATIHAVDLPWLGRVDFGLLAVPLSMFWLVGFTNAFNFMDGINGISGTTLVVSGGAFAIAGAQHGDTDTLLSGTLLAGGALGFLPWNFPRAKIFMGDAGALPLGLLLAVTAVQASRDGRLGLPMSLPFPACVLLLGPYLFDVSLTLFRRWRQKKPLAQAHRDHLYQRLARGLRSHAAATLAVGAVEMATAWLALTYGWRNDLGRALSLLLPLIALLTLVPWISRRESRASSSASDAPKG